jgi:hypothetical protein
MEDFQNIYQQRLFFNNLDDFTAVSSLKLTRFFPDMLIYF